MNTSARLIGRPVATARSQNPLTSAASGSPRRPALVSHAFNASMPSSAIPWMLLLTRLAPGCHDGRSATGHLLQAFGVPSPLHPIFEVLLVCGRTVEKAHSHAAEPNGRNFQVALSEFALPQVFSDLTIRINAQPRFHPHAPRHLASAGERPERSDDPPAA